MKRFVAALCLLPMTVLCAQEPGPAEAPILSVGAAAPALKVAHWLKGTPITAFQPGKIYLLEFFSPRQPDCRARLADLSAIQSELADKGLSVICISGEHFRSSRADLEAMLESRGKDLTFSVAWDDERTTTFAYMVAAQRAKLPCTFLVDKEGRIAYMGRRWVELAINGVLDGSWTRETSEKKIAVAKQELEGLRTALVANPKESAERIAAFKARYPFGLLTDHLNEHEFAAHLRAEAFDKATAVGAIIVQRATLAEDAATLNSIAWAIVDPNRKLAKRDLALAVKAAEQAAVLTKHKSAPILDTLARVWFWKQDFKQAVQWQEKAVGAKDALDPYRKTLEDYKKLLEKTDTD